MPEANATFFTFNVGGSNKWKYDGRGYLSPEVFQVHTVPERREQILKDNGGKLPGLSTAGRDMIWVVIGDKENDHGWPLLLYP
jgi:hypothetical protein